MRDFILMGGAGRDQSLVGSRLPALEADLAVMRKGSSVAEVARAAISARLRLERTLGAERTSGLLDAAMNAIGAPAFLANDRGFILHVNDAAAALLGARLRDTCARVAEGIGQTKRQPAVACHDSFARVDTGGSAPMWLVVFRSGGTRSVAEIADASARWNLTARECDVLRLLVRGDANKDIATALGCALGTVEVHVGTILRKSGLESRAQVVARVWIGR